MLTIAVMQLSTANKVEGDTSVAPYYMYNAANNFQIDLSLLYAVCSIESHCRSEAINKDDATSSRKARGIVEHSFGMFQIKLATARSLGFTGGRKDLMKPEVNVWYAAKLLRHLYNHYGQNTVKVISAYNAGRYTVYNKKYVNKVLQKYARYKIDKRF